MLRERESARERRNAYAHVNVEEKEDLLQLDVQLCAEHRTELAQEHMRARPLEEQLRMAVSA